MAQWLMDQFLEGCGAVGPLTLEVTTAEGGNQGCWSLPQPFALIGRDPRAEVALTDPQVSKRHVYLQILAGRLFWMDLESRAGVVRDGVPATMGWLRLGEAITVGPYQIRVTGGLRAESDADPGDWPDPLQVAMLPQEPLADDRVWLELDRPARKPLRRRLRRVLTLIGRAPTCRVRFVDVAISRFHAALLRTARGLWVVDLLNRTGMRVNDRPVRWSGLAVGDEIQADTYRFRVRNAEAADRAGHRSEPGSRAALASLRAVRPFDLVPLPEPSSRAVSGPSGPTEPPAPFVETILEPVLARLGQMQEQMFDQYHEAMMSMLQVVGTLHREQVGQVRQELDRIQQLTRELQTLQDRTVLPPPRAPEPPTPMPLKPGLAAPSGSTTPTPNSSSESDLLAAPAVIPADPNAAAYHALISRRMAAIRDERQNRWQKIIGMVTGGNGSRPGEV